MVPDELVRVFARYERKSAQIVRENLKAGDLFVDVGANFGFYSVLARSVVGDAGRVISIEPSPETAKILKKNLADYGNVDIVEMAVSQCPGFIDFFHTDDFVNSGVAKSPPFIPNEKVTKVSVQADSLDKILMDVCSIKNINFLKIDVQGEDIAVLDSAKEILRNSMDLKLLIEWAPEWMRNVGFDPMGFPAALGAFGFKNLVCIDDRSETLMSVDDFLSRVKIDLSGKIYCNVYATK